MSGLLASLMTLAATCLGTGAGAFLRTRLPAGHLDDAKDVIRLGAGLLATISALVISLLISSAKLSYDTQVNRVRQLTSNVILLDQTLERYGPETTEARGYLRGAIELLVDRIWRQEASKAKTTGPYAPTAAAELAFERISELSPQTDAQRFLKNRAMQVFLDLAQSRFLQFVEGRSDAIPLPFLVILLFWLTIIFASFSLFSRPNPINLVALLLFAISASGAVFLILELSQPFVGMMKISSGPFSDALAPLKQ
jgi:hypothetical protein